MSTAASNRSFSAPPAIHNIGMSYLWDSALVVNTNTGNWRSVTPADLAGNSATGTFTPTTSFITGSQTIIPAGYKSASVAVISGYGWIGGTGPFYAGTVLSYGGYDGSWMSSSALVIGGTGSTGSPTNIAIIWEN